MTDRIPVNNRPGVYRRVRDKGTVYEARYREQAIPGSGKKGRLRSRTFPTAAEASAFLKTVNRDVLVGDYIAPEAGLVTFGAVAAAWLKEKEAKCKATTLDGYAIVLRTWLKRWDSRPVNSLKRTDLLALLADMNARKRKPQTVRNVFLIVHGVLDVAVYEGYIRVSPYAAFQKNLPSASRKKVRALTAPEVARLAMAMPAPYDLLVTFAAWTGLRRGEIAGLRAGRVDAKSNRVHVVETVVDLSTGERQQDTPKSEKSTRIVPIPPPLARLLANHIAAHALGPDDYVWSEPDGTALNMPRFYRGKFATGCKNAGLVGVRIHDLRHTFASLMALQGEQIFHVSRWMGHSTIAITADIYTHIFEGEDEALAKRMGDAFLAAQVGSNAVPIRKNAG